MAGAKLKYAGIFEEADELIKDGITIENAARYLGVPADVLRYHYDPYRRASQSISSKNWSERNKERKSEYDKWYTKNVYLPKMRSTPEGQMKLRDLSRRAYRNARNNPLRWEELKKYHREWHHRNKKRNHGK